MNGFTPRAVWDAIRRARLLRVLVVYLTSAFVVLQIVDIFVDRLALPDWFFPGSLILLLIGLPIIIATALAQSAPAVGPASPILNPATADDNDPPVSRASWTGRSHASAGIATGAEPTSPEAARSSRAAASTGAPSGPAAESGPAARRPPAPVPGGAPVSLSDVAAVAREWLTWHRAIGGGILAFTLLIMAVSGYTAMRTLGIGPVGSLVAAGVLEARDRVLIADFDSPTGDTLLAGVVTEAFRVDFAQSPLLAVVEPGFVRGALQRMERDPASRLSQDLAREVALRDGIKAVITGEIAAAGGGYVISARLMAAESGEVLAAFRETATHDAVIIPAIDRLSKRLRERIGESLRTIRANAPLEQVTTASLDALVRYTQAVHASDVAGDDERAIALLEEAVALDPEFAMAYRKLAVILGNRGLQRARRIEAATRAYEYRDRLTERERYLTIAQYHMGVTGDRDQAILAYRTLLSIIPDDHASLNNLGVLYWQQRDWQRAAEQYTLAWQVDSTTHLPLTNLVVVLYNLGRGDEARATNERVTQRFPGVPQYLSYGAGMEAADGNYAEAADLLHELAASRPDDIGWGILVASRLAALARLQGRLAEADRHVEAAIRANERRGTPEGALAAASQAAFNDARLRGDRARAVARLDEALARFPLAGLDHHDRPYVAVAHALAEIGEPDRIRELMADFDRALGGEQHRDVRLARTELEVTLAYAEQRWQDVLRLLPEVDPGPCIVCLPALEGQAHDALGHADAAIAAYERFLETPYIWRTWMDAGYRAGIYERLADLYELRGDTAKARLYLASLVDLWRDADPELQPRVRAAQRRLAELAAERVRG